MIIERPVYFIEIIGDVKEYASHLPSTIIASYEKYIDTTYVVVVADENDYSEDVANQYREIHYTLKAKNSKGHLKIRYLKDGINFKSFHKI